jgi:hypothetical protein
MKPDPKNPAWQDWMKAPTSSWLRVGLHGFDLDRQFLPPSHWTLRIVLGADEAEARFYELDVSWTGDAPDAKTALDSVRIDITELSAQTFGALVGHERDAKNG